MRYDEVGHLREIVQHMAALAGESFEPASADGTGARRRQRGPASPAQDAAIQIVNKHRRPMKAAEVARELQKDANAVGAAMWAAWKAGRLRKTGAGTYAPQDYIPPPDNLLVSHGEADEK